MQHNGADHVIVPVVMIVDGVLNDALVTHEEYGRLVEAWNDKPVPVHHPEVNGEFASAGSPDVIDKMVLGRVYNAKVEGDKLVGELWLDVAKAERIGRLELINAMESGAVVEVSTGYYSTREDKQGEFNGKPYLYIDRDIIPDHLALLPNEIGACSVDDGCGTRPVVNMFKRIAEAFGLRTNCKDEVKPTMCTKKELVEKLVGNAKLSAEQLESLMAMDPEQLAMMQAVAGALSQAPATAEEDEPVEEDPAAMQANASQGVTLEQIEALIDRKFTANANVDVIARIKANESNALSEATLKAMSRDELEKYEASIRPVDYSGFGGPAAVVANSGNVSPLTPPRGLVARVKKEAK